MTEHSEPMTCPQCGTITTEVTEERVTEPRRLCEPRDETREPGSRWRRYEPCGHGQKVDEPNAGDVKTLRVMVTVDTNELREWADRHADAGRHGVAHVLYKAAADGESLTKQALAAARREGGDEMRRAAVSALIMTGRHTSETANAALDRACAAYLDRESR